MPRIPSFARSGRTTPSSARLSTTSPSTTPRPMRSSPSKASADDAPGSVSEPPDDARDRPRPEASRSPRGEASTTGATERLPESVTHFSGVWEDEAKTEVTRAIQAAERLIAHRNEFPVPTFGSQWVCVADEVVDRTYFLAHRLGATNVLRGTSVQELKDAICAFALEH